MGRNPGFKDWNLILLEFSMKSRNLDCQSLYVWNRVTTFFVFPLSMIFIFDLFIYTLYIVYNLLFLVLFFCFLFRILFRFLQSGLSCLLFIFIRFGWIILYFTESYPKFCFTRNVLCRHFFYYCHTDFYSLTRFYIIHLHLFVFLFTRNHNFVSLSVSSLSYSLNESPVRTTEWGH